MRSRPWFQDDGHKKSVGDPGGLRPNCQPGPLKRRQQVPVELVKLSAGEMCTLHAVTVYVDRQISLAICISIRFCCVLGDWDFPIASLPGFSAFWLPGFRTSWLSGSSASWLSGFSAFLFAGLWASCFLGLIFFLITMFTEVARTSNQQDVHPSSMTFDHHVWNSGAAPPPSPYPVVLEIIQGFLKRVSCHRLVRNAGLKSCGAYLHFGKQSS